MNFENLQLNGMELFEQNVNFSGEQIIYLDFDGAKNVSYDNEELNIHINGFDIADSGLTGEQQQKIITELNNTFANTGVYFTTELTEDTEYSTIYVGGAGSAFAQYGNFLGLSETIDVGNQIKNDEAFVFSDNIYSASAIAASIAHEAGHLLGYKHDSNSENIAILRDFANSGDYFISFHTWNQGYGIYLQSGGTSDITYNQYTPTVGGVHAWVGCSATATSQIIYYWGWQQILAGKAISVNSISFDNSDQYTSIYQGINIDGDATSRNFLSFAQLNEKLSNIQYQFDPDEIAALSFGIGVKLKADYDIDGTGAALSASLMQELGFSATKFAYEYDSDGLMVSSKFDLKQELIDNALAAHPVIVSMEDVDTDYRHAVIVDGYNSITDTFHFNMGWGGSSDGWYSLANLPSGYDNIYQILYDIYLDSGTAQIIEIDALDKMAGEPGDDAMVGIFRTGDTTNALTVYFSVGGTATAGSDYVLKNGSIELTNSVVIAAGQSSVYITLDVIDDAIAEGDETAVITLTSNAAYTIGAVVSETINISDDDNAVDVTGPSVPDNLKQAVSGNNVALDWSDSTDNKSGVKQYIVEYVNNKNMTGASSLISTLSENSVSNFTVGQWYWRVKAEDNAGNVGDWSSVSSFKVLPEGEYEINPSDGAADDSFGSGVAIAGDWMLVGAYGDDDKGLSSGSVYVYHLENGRWTENNKLTAHDGSTYACFGEVVSISGDWAVVGTNSQKAYIFHRTGNQWSEFSTVSPDESIGYNAFSISLSISGDLLAVGASSDNSAVGSAYIYRWNGSNWAKSTKLTASDGSANDYFGWSVSVSGDWAIAGAYNDDDKGTNSGSAYIYHWTGNSWVQQTKLTAFDGTANDWFGYSVSISGDWAVVGANKDDALGGMAGSAYVYQWNGSDWNLFKKLTPSAYQANDIYFGESVSISGDYLVVANPGASNQVKGYIYHWDGSDWIEEKQIKYYGNDDAGVLGRPVATDGKRVVTGATLNDINGTNSGDAFVYNLNVDLEPPEIPSGLTKTISANSVSFDWNDSYDSGSGLSNYLLEYAVDNQFSGAVQISVSVSDASIANLAEGIYYWRVQAVDNADNASSWVSGDSFMVDITAPVPAVLTRTVTGSSVALDWADVSDVVSGVKNYEFQIDNNSNFSSNEKSGVIVDSSVTVSGLPDDSYYWRVRTYDNAGNASAWVSGDSFMVDITAPVPAVLTRTVTGSSVALDWADVSDVVSGVKNYEFQIDNNSDFSSNEKFGVIVDSSVTVSGLTDDSYYWRVRTRDNAGNISSWGIGTSFTVDSKLPVVGIAITDATSSEPLNDGIFRIYRTGAMTAALTVYFSTSGTAVSGVDYILKSGNTDLTNSVVIASGQSYVDVTLDVIDDMVVESTENVSLTLTADTAYTLGANFSGSIYIADNDVADNTLPAIPGGLTQTITGNDVAFNWDDSSDASGIKQYELRVDNNINFSSPEYTETVLTSQSVGTYFASGTYYWQIRAQDNAGNWSSWSASDSFAIQLTNSVNSDFNGNGTSDILWHNQTSGTVGIWEGGATWQMLGAADAASWEIVGIGDFNNNGTSDVLWQNKTNGYVGEWESGTNWQGLGAVSRTDWEIVGIGDFNGNGTSDILWQNKVNGYVGDWESGANWQGLGTVSRTDWEVVGIGDFNGNGTSDILWQNKINGYVGDWESGANWQGLGAVSRTDWEVVGIGDFNGNGTSDILWQNKSTGYVGAWESGANWQGLGAVSHTDWEVAGVGDFNGNGTSDILWRNKQDGFTGMWESGTDWQALGGASNDWKICIA